MYIKKKLLKITTLLVVIFAFTGCEDDFETIGGNIIGEPNFNADLYTDAEISAYTNNIGSVQTNNLQTRDFSTHLLGVYEDEVFGKQVANILSQVMLSELNPSFGTQPVLDSVVLTIPYFSTQLENEEGETGTQYRLDSVYGNEAIRLSVLESGFFLNEYDPETDFESAQKYYSDMQPQIESNLTNNVLFQSENFAPSSSEVIEFTQNDEGEQDTLRHAPRMKLKLSTEFFQQKILNKGGAIELSSQDNFRNYFRGVYLKAEEIANGGNMMLLNLAHENAGITLYYKDEATEDDEQRTFRLRFGPARVNLFEQDSPDFDDDRLYLKGGEGSMAVIELFSGVDTNGDGISDELEFLRDSNWLINEANLTFYVDQNAMAGLAEPQRVFLYNLDTNTVLADYVLDQPGSMNRMNSNSNRNHLGPLEVNDNGSGLRYKVKITRHLEYILNNNVENPRLGLVVSQNVNLLSMSAVRQSQSPVVETVPGSSVITPKGTVLYGPEAENEEKRLQLRIYYTESKN